MRKRNTTAPRFFDPLHGVWLSDETDFFVFDILLGILMGRRANQYREVFAFGEQLKGYHDHFNYSWFINLITL